MSRVIAIFHHEKWDGSRYPKGLTGEEIPLVGRVTAIADAFDALTTERPYKKAWTVEDAVSLIGANAGSHFDPALVSLFHDVLPEILKIKELLKICIGLYPLRNCRNPLRNLLQTRALFLLYPVWPLLLPGVECRVNGIVGSTFFFVPGIGKSCPELVGEAILVGKA